MQGYKTSCSVVAYPCFDTAPAYFCLMSDELPESVLTGAEAFLEQQNRIYCSEEARNTRGKNTICIYILPKTLKIELFVFVGFRTYFKMSVHCKHFSVLLIWRGKRVTTFCVRLKKVLFFRLFPYFLAKRKKFFHHILGLG